MEDNEIVSNDGPRERPIKKHIDDTHPHECPQCDASFIFFSDLIQHFKESHENVRR